MSFKLLVVLAMVGLVGLAAAELSEEQRTLHMKVGLMQKFIYSDKEKVEPEKVKELVTELVENLYEALPLPKHASSVEQWFRTLTTFLYSFSQVSKENCPDIADYNKSADTIKAKFANSPNALGMLQFYQAKQNQLCM